MVSRRNPCIRVGEKEKINERIKRNNASATIGE
jgi:hypothetical protein